MQFPWVRSGPPVIGYFAEPGGRRTSKELRFARKWSNLQFTLQAWMSRNVKESLEVVKMPEIIKAGKIKPHYDQTQYAAIELFAAAVEFPGF